MNMNMSQVPERTTKFINSKCPTNVHTDYNNKIIDDDKTVKMVSNSW